MYVVTSQNIIEVIRDEICNCDLNVSFICNELSCSKQTINRRVKEEFNINTSELIESIRLFKIFKYTFDHKYNIYVSARYYGIENRYRLIKILRKRFDKTPSQIQYELVISESARENFLNYHRSFLIDNLIL